MAQCLDSVAYLASGNVLLYCYIHPRPVEISRYEFSRSKGSKVASFGIVMEKNYHFAAGRFWYIYVLVQSRRMSLRRETGPFTESHPQ